MRFPQSESRLKYFVESLTSFIEAYECRIGEIRRTIRERNKRLGSLDSPSEVDSLATFSTEPDWIGPELPSEIKDFIPPDAWEKYFGGLHRLGDLATELDSLEGKAGNDTLKRIQDIDQERVRIVDITLDVLREYRAGCFLQLDAFSRGNSSGIPISSVLRHVKGQLEKARRDREKPLPPPKEEILTKRDSMLQFVDERREIERRNREVERLQRMADDIRAITEPGLIEDGPLEKKIDRTEVDPIGESKRGKQHRYTADDRVAILYKNTPESRGWKSPEVARALSTATSVVTADAVRKTNAWKINREIQKELRANRKRET